MTISAPSRLAQMVNCSTAAARKVSAAPSTTFLPSAWNMQASLAIEVVLPQPFTPATMMTVGPLAAKRIGSAGWASRALSCLLDRARGSRPSCTTRARKLVADLVGDLLRRLDAHVGLDQRLEQLVEERVVDQPPLGLEEVADVGVQQLRGLLQTLLEFFE